MKRILCILLTMAALLVVYFEHVSADTPNYPELGAKCAQKFVPLIEEKKWPELAKLIYFPLDVNVEGGKNFQIKDEEEFLKDPEKCFTEKTIAEIKKHDFKSEMFCRNLVECMLSQGVLWMEVEDDGTCKIIAINQQP